MGGETPKIQSNQQLDQLRLDDALRRHTPHPSAPPTPSPARGEGRQKTYPARMCEHRSAEAGIQLKPTVVRG